MQQRSVGETVPQHLHTEPPQQCCCGLAKRTGGVISLGFPWSQLKGSTYGVCMMFCCCARSDGQKWGQSMPRASYECASSTRSRRLPQNPSLLGLRLAEDSTIQCSRNTGFQCRHSQKKGGKAESLNCQNSLRAQRATGRYAAKLRHPS